MSSLRILKFSALAFVLTALAISSKAQTAISATVDFGNPPEGGGACSGKGLCTVKPVETTEDGTGVNTTFTLSADRNVLMISFSQADVVTKQPGQVTYINAAATSYNFDAPYNFTNPIFAPLGLKPGARITTGTPNTLTIDAGVVTISYLYMHY